MKLWQRAALAGVTCVLLRAQTPDPAWEPLDRAFAAQRVRDYDAAIAHFRAAVQLAPKRPDIRKNLAYTLLKTGETDEAREQFGEASRLDPADFHVALEYAFLCYEAQTDTPARRAEARHLFAHIRDHGDAESRATAEAAFRNIDAPLAAGIARWQQALATSTPTFSAHFELAQLAEQREEPALAVTHYRAAFTLLPTRRSVLLDLARAEKATGNSEGWMAALIAASRGPEPRSAEMAREQLPDRYPYVYEFRRALELDPTNAKLHGELAWLIARMAEEGTADKADARREFEDFSARWPDDFLAAAQLGLLILEAEGVDAAMPLLRRVLDNADAATANRVRMALKMPLVLENRNAALEPTDPRVLAERSYNAGFLRDALRYFTAARENNPVDSSIALKLGWTNNMLHDDRRAFKWFNLARRSPDPAIAAEAERAYRNLAPDQKRVRTSAWIFPLASTRWKDVFGYGQLKSELQFRWLKPYLSLRYSGDLRRQTGGLEPQALSESALIFAVGAATPIRHGVMAWAESGRAVSYAGGKRWADYRGGVSWARTFRRAPWFLESNADAVFLSHFQNNFINYSQNRIGRPVRIAGFSADALLSVNVTIDTRRQYWANFTEFGPGLRFSLPGLRGAQVMASAIRGVYLMNDGNPRGPSFTDFRIGVWYALAR